MSYIDFHCHLDWESFNKDRKELILELEKNKIIAFSNTVTPKNYFETKKLFKNSNNIRVTPGLYPTEAEIISDKEFNEYLNLLEKEKNNFEFFGEVGLDFYKTKDLNLRNKQEKRFKQIIEFAIKLDKPLCIHTRGAEEKVIEIIEEYIKKTNFNKFNLHCFSGKKKLIKKIIELKIFCSIPLTILNTEHFKNLVLELPIKQILVETDSPFLNPSKERNSPLNVPIIYKEIAKIKGLNEIEIENIIYKNYLKLII